MGGEDNIDRQLLFSLKEVSWTSWWFPDPCEGGNNSHESPRDQQAGQLTFFSLKTTL